MAIFVDRISGIMHIPFRVKVCGITSVEDAVATLDAGADAIGLNFVPASSRCITLDEAQEIALAVKGRCQVVGVFANQSRPDIEKVLAMELLDFVQLHGVEEPEAFQQPLARPILKTVPWRKGAHDELSLSRRWSDVVGENLAGYVIDAFDPVLLGGTGKAVDWDSLLHWREAFPDHYWILAGGLNPSNVTEAIARTQAIAVDVASGVEKMPRVKSAAEVKAFASRALAAWHKSSN